MEYNTQKPLEAKFPWDEFLEQTKLPKRIFQVGLIPWPRFTKEVESVYKTKGSMLTDEEMFHCLEAAYFPMFEAFFVDEDIFFAEGKPAKQEPEGTQPQIEGFFYDSQAFSKEEYKRRYKSKRHALNHLSKALYGDPHAWFSDFEEYFQKQRKEQ